MSASFTYVVCYHVTATCVTPLRSGGVDGNTETILRDAEGRAMLQGYSISGALRDWMEQRYGTDETRKLFGSQRYSSSLVVSDGLFEANAATTIRPRLKINPTTGAAAGQFKFDVAHVSPKSRFTFEMTWLGMEKSVDTERQIEQMLSAMQRGDIRLGGQKSNGFGRVSIRVEKRCYDMQRENDRIAWAEGLWDGVDLKLPELEETQCIRFEVKAHAPRILVKAGAPRYANRIRITEHLRERNQPVIPGSSVKGTVLSRIRSIAHYLHISEDILDAAFGRGAIKREGEKGDNGRPCRFSFEDIYFQNDKSSKSNKIARIRIDRFTGGVIRGALFQEEVFSGDIVLRVSAPVGYPQACGLLFYALRDLGLGLYNLGSTGAIGRGYLDVEKITVVCGSQKSVLTFGTDGTMDLDDPAALVQSWLETLEVRE